MIGRVVLVALVVLSVLFVVGNDGRRSSPDRAPAPDRAPDRPRDVVRDYDFGLIGDSYDAARLREERAAGIETKVLELGWSEYYPGEDEKDVAYVGRKRAEIEELRAGGFKIILSLGYHDPPTWIHENYHDSYYVNQFGDRWTGDTFVVGDEVILDADGVVRGTPTDNGDANLVFNPRLRHLAADYMEEVMRDFGTDFFGVRLGGGRYGEVTYPPVEFGDNSNLYWAYDRNAQESAAEAGIEGWRPGDASPDGEARRFVDWYMNSLVDYQDWQVKNLRRAGYRGRIMLLYPGLGVRPGDIEQAAAGNLEGSTPAEAEGAIQGGRDFARQVGAIRDDNVLVTTTALDVPASGDEGEDRGDWSPVKYLSVLAGANPARPGLYGENTGPGSREDMLLAAAQMRRYGLVGMSWYDEEQLFSGRYATLDDYESVIEYSRGDRG